MQKINFFLALGVWLAFSGCGNLNRLESLDEKENGFAFYRSGQPTDKDLDAWCDMGVQRIFALNGMAAAYAAQLVEKCPSARVVFNKLQDPDVGLTKEFIAEFDRSVQEAMALGEKVLIHCYCGCHRTGRLAAYYRMKYQGWTAEQAIEEMLRVGTNMGNHPSLPAQVRAMEDHIKKRACKQDAVNCLRDEAPTDGSRRSPEGR